VTSATRLCGATFCNVQLYDGERMHIAAVYNFSPEAEAAFRKMYPRPPDRTQIASRAVLTGAPVYVPDLLEDPDFPRGFAITGGWRAIFSVPMLRNGKAVGAITVARSEPAAFSVQHVELLNTFADQAVIAIENTRLLNELRQRTTDLTQSLHELRTTQDRLVQTEKLASLGQLTAGIAHEIKNPLNFVNNFSGISAELIGELQNTLSTLSVDPEMQAEIKDLTDTLRGNLEKVVQHGRRADAIVKSMLMHSGESSGQHQPTDINALVEESLNRAYYNARAEQRGFAIKLEKSFDPAAGEANLFPREIARALLNLISNGFYAATKGNAEANGGEHEPTLAAATKNLGDRVEIRIRDNGMGIPADVMEKMFDPFFTTKPAGEGTGLGLSISHDIIVKQHGGSIEVDTEPGEFAEIRVILPRSSGAIS
jgi:two-component system, NtrC family, sensor kinase